MPIVVPELKLSNVQRQIFFADLVEASHDPTLSERPEAFDGLSVDRADDILATRMVHGVERIFVSEFAIAGPLVGAKQADFVRDGFANEGGQGSRLEHSQ